METKRIFKFFSIFEHEKEEEYLRRMHRLGWKLDKVSGFAVYHFEKCIPEDVIYRLDYNKDSIRNKEEYVKMFNDCGWEYLQDYVGYSYFRKPASEAIGSDEIFCDEDSRKQMFKRVCRGRALESALNICVLMLIAFAVGNWVIKKTKATPHNHCRTDVKPDFSSDETKSGGNTLCIAEHFCEI